MPKRILKTYGGLNIGMACLYLFFFNYVVPPYSTSLRWGFGALSLLMITAGLLLLLEQPLGRLLGILVGYLLVGLTFVVTAMLVAAVAYLRGVYGAFGKGASYATMVGIAVVIPYFGLPGAFLLARLYRRDVREYLAR